MPTPDAELAAVMRRMLADQKNTVILWGADSVLEIQGFAVLTEDEAAVIQEVLRAHQ